MSYSTLRDYLNNRLGPSEPYPPNITGGLDIIESLHFPRDIDEVAADGVIHDYYATLGYSYRSYTDKRQGSRAIARKNGEVLFITTTLGNNLGFLDGEGFYVTVLRKHKN